MTWGVVLSLAVAGLVAYGLAAVVRSVRSEPPEPEGKVTSSPVIRPHFVRPQGPQDWREIE